MSTETGSCRHWMGSETMTEELFIAKSGGLKAEWLPLIVHLEDTTGIMKKLLRNMIADSFSDSCGLSLDELERAALFIAYTHDIGKATVAFQYRIGKAVPERLSVLERYIQLPEEMDRANIAKTPHALAGEVILRYLGCPDGVAAVVGAHHGTPAKREEIKSQRMRSGGRVNTCPENYFGYKQGNVYIFEEVWRCFVQTGLERAGVDSAEELPELSDTAQMLLCGLLITADWIASNTEFFPLISVDDPVDGLNIAQRVDEAWRAAGFPDAWEPCRELFSDTDFRQCFGFLPRDTQRDVMNIVEAAQEPGLFILEAPMGCGKTEAALASAEMLASYRGRNGLFFGLPTQATANGIFPRIISWAENQAGELFNSIQLRHGSADLNVTFKNIQRGIPEGDAESSLVVHSWFCDSKKACLADFVVATVDNMLMAALKRRHVMLLHLGLAQKVVIIDEVHAYDAYMNRYLERALQWLGAYGTPVILLSATLPSQRRMSLVRAYLGIVSSDYSFEENISYPLLTWTDGTQIKQEPLSYSGKHTSVRIQKIICEDIVEIVRSATAAGGCVGIIVNTVNRAQKMAQMIRRIITENVLLYHAQFIMPDRVAKESELLEKIGKTSTPEKRRGLVVIGTQVLEQSLDIDFDLLITDICPIDLLLQRMGRLHRHERELRPEELREPVCCVMTDELEGERNGSKLIYGEWLLKETEGILPDTVLLPNYISPLVQQVYGKIDSSEEYQKYISDIKISESHAGSFLMDVPGNSADDTIHGLLDKTINDEHAEASVRDGISSLEVLVMRMGSDGLIRFLDGITVSQELDDDECIRIAGQKLRLPSRFSMPWNIDRNIHELEEKCRKHIGHWQKHYLLAGQLVLFLDDNLEGELEGFRLRYSYDNGLICEKESDVNE